MTAATAGSATAHKVDTDFTGENVRSYAATGLGSWPRVFRDLSCQFSRIDRLSAMFGEKEFAGYLGPHLRPISSRQRRFRRQAGRGIDRRDAFGHFKPERADVPIEDLERRAQLGHFLEIADSDVWPFQLLLLQAGQRM